MKLDKPTEDEHRGEGDRVSTRRYPRAEARARHGPRPTRVSLDELVAQGHTVIERMAAVVRRVARRFGRR